MRFVILDHQPPADAQRSSARTMTAHFDLMIETEESDRLKTFALAELPPPGDEREFETLPDHRADFLDYEGPISENRGSVTRFANGTWSGDLSRDVTLRFDADSKHFAGKRWTLRWDHDSNRLLRLSSAN